jgi:hypothetical protein
LTDWEGKMKSSRFRAGLAVIALFTIIIGCSQQKAELVVDTGKVAYSDSTAEFPRLVFADGQTSLNDRCMVRMAKLNRKMPPMFVNGKAVGFC